MPVHPRRRLPAAPLVALVAIVAGVVAVIVVGMRSNPPKGPAAVLHLPSLKNLGASPGACAESVYPAGVMYRFERCDGSSPIGWSRCSTVTWSVDPTNAPTGYRADINAAFADLGRATGLHLQEVGSSGAITLSWDTGLYDPQPGTSGEAGVTTFSVQSGLTSAKATGATIRLSSHLQAGGTAGVAELPVLLHELGHATGLDHYSGPVVMNPLDRGFTSYQPGDLAGLVSLYQPASCANAS